MSAPAAMHLSRPRDLNRSARNIASAYRIANIAANDATILSYYANPKTDRIFGKDRYFSMPSAEVGGEVRKNRALNC